MLSVVMPAHNEAGYLETAVREVDEGLRARGHELEILVVENGSTDDTLAIGRRLAEALPSVLVSTRPVADYGAARATASWRHAASSSSPSTSTTTTSVSSTTR
jgi:glycosyltransferase involved in cell wall biosynthesis